MSSSSGRRERGTGNIYQRGDKWVGRIDISTATGRGENGQRKFKYFSGKSAPEVKRKILQYIKENDYIASNTILVSDYVDSWLTSVKLPTLKRSSYDRLENTVNHQIKPYIGDIQLQQLSADDIQDFMMELKEEGKSYSTIKKAYDCIKAVTKYAVIARDIDRDPMLLVSMFSKSQFEEKEIVYFTASETKAIIEEVNRKYATGSPVYPYGEAYILMLNTGLREGELIALWKSDWDEEAKTLHVQRTAQSVKKRDSGGASGGYEIIYNSTKTYSGKRVIYLNEGAQNAIKSMVARYPKSQFLMCNSNGDVIPPANFARSFYRILKNVGLPQTGPHALRHTFASICFDQDIDVKTISKILGHASVSITLNTYVHLIRDKDKDAILEIDKVLL